MAVTNIPNVQNWTVTPQNGQAGYFTAMNTWLGQSTLVIASLQSAITAQNAANSEINTLATQTENNAIIATGLAEYQGEHNTITTYSKGQSTSVAGLYYTSKVDGNLNHAVTDVNYWLPNPINDKVNQNLNPETSKTTPIDTDLLPLSDSETTFTLKKLTWANLKNSLKVYFDPIYANFIANDARVKAAVNATGPAPIYAARAFVNFDGSGVVSIRNSGNVSSITDNGVGDYTVNFINNMQDTSFTANPSSNLMVNRLGAYSTSSVQVLTGRVADLSGNTT
jgi:hypothetical protein